MNIPVSAPLSIEALKGHAKRLRAKLNSDGKPTTHSKSLELLAHQYGYKDWNTLHAAIGDTSPTCPISLGARVRGKYFGQAFEGEVIGVEKLSTHERFRVTLHFDEPVDVVTFESFSNWRQRVSCIITSSGVTIEKTSNGCPHLQLEI